ncbi:hypothetical protein FB45DRAFT_895226 [Roridomyces roridus]|uniref:Uncharacterized protein n=1 Tax=Roridomyces roridus TaxID=1738132 RepID=A0AAD7FXD1_9AGAR|nr:hypothetical protein FB45DRAFT_895226 [Roridomyces roridus]
MAVSEPLDQLGLILSPHTPPHVPDILLCKIDCYKIVTVVAAVDSKVTPVSARHLSRWLYLLARYVNGARPIRSPAVYRPITVTGGSVLVRHLHEIDTEEIPYDSPDRLRPGCYALFVSNDNQYPHLFGRIGRPAAAFADTAKAWKAEMKCVPEDLVKQARERDKGLCCFTGRPSELVAWVIYPALAPVVSLPQCGVHHVDNVLTISPLLLQAYYENLITVDPQDQYRIVAFKKLADISLLERLSSPPSSGRFWHSSLCWTLATRFDGPSKKKAERLTDDLLEGDECPPSEKDTVLGREALRAVHWRRWDDIQDRREIRGTIK